MKSKIASALAALDNLSPTWALNVEGRDRVKTKTGGLLVLLCISTLLAYAISSLVTYIKRKKYDQLESYLESSSHASPLNLFDLKRLPMLSVANENGDYIPASEIRRFVSVQFVVYDRATQTNFTHRAFSFVNCSSLAAEHADYFGGQSEMETELAELEGYLCLNMSQVRDVTLEGNFDEGVEMEVKGGGKQRVYAQGYRQGSIFIGPCSGTDCNVTSEQLAGFTYKLAFFEVLYNYSNYKRPLSYTTTLFHSDLIDPSLTRMIFADVSRTKVRDNLGLPFGVVTKDSFTTVTMKEDLKRPRLATNSTARVLGQVSKRRMMQDQEMAVDTTATDSSESTIDETTTSGSTGTAPADTSTPQVSSDGSTSQPENQSGDTFTFVSETVQVPTPDTNTNTPPDTGSIPEQNDFSQDIESPLSPEISSASSNSNTEPQVNEQSSSNSDQPTVGSENTEGFNFGESQSTSTSTQNGSASSSTTKQNSFKNSRLPYVTFILEASLSEQTVIRTYKPLTDVLAAIGGMKVNVFLLFAFLHSLIGSSLHKYVVVEKVYGIVPETTGYLCCKKKKGEVGSQNSRGSFFVTQDTFDKAYAKIVSSLDVVSLSKEMNILRFISSSILQDYHLALIPLMAIDKSLVKQILANMQNSTDKQKRRLPERKSKRHAKTVHKDENGNIE